MPMRWGRRLRKRWRWAGAFGDEVIVFAAAVEVGPARTAFWGILDRQRGELRERTRRGLPWRGPEVAFDGSELAISSRQALARLSFGEGAAIESICSNGQGGYTWTRKLAGVPVRGLVLLDGAWRRLEARGAIDESAGYHARHTSWLWSAGVGAARDGRELAWNLVSGVNDPERNSERAIWVDGEPSEPDPVAFEGLDAIRFADGTRLEFTAEAERARRESLPPLVRSEYRAPLGVFGGSLAGIELESGIGVMESHDVLW